MFRRNGLGLFIHWRCTSLILQCFSLTAAAWTPLNSIKNINGVEARKELRDGNIPITWASLTDTDMTRGTELATLFSTAHGNLTIPHDSPLFRAANEEKKEEYLKWYQSEGLDPADNELSPIHAMALLRAIQLSPTDNFIDLGCSRGSVVLVASATTGAHSCTGVELSPRNHRAAQRSREALLACGGGKQRVEFYQGDARTTVCLGNYSVLFCAIRGVATRPVIMDDILQSLTSEAVQKSDGEAARKKSVRLICVGFGVDVKDKPYAEKVTLARAYAIRDDNAGEGDALALYGVGEGPRVLLEYNIELGGQ